jgi:hypothetical protein
MHHENSPTQTAIYVKYLAKNIAMVSPPPHPMPREYSADLTPSDFFLPTPSPKLKLKGKRFSNILEIKQK